MGKIQKLTAALQREASVLSRTYYHATYLDDAQKIARSGFRINMARGRGRVLGPAVYVTGDRDFAEGYGNDIRYDEERDAGMLHMRLNVTRFLDVDPKLWPDDVVEAMGGRPGGQVNYPKLGDVARKLGYQACGNPKANVAVFDPKRIQVVKVEPMPA